MKKSRAKAIICIKSCFGLGFFSRNVNSVNKNLEQRIEKFGKNEKDSIRKGEKGGSFYISLFKERERINILRIGRKGSCRSERKKSSDQ